MIITIQLPPSTNIIKTITTTKLQVFYVMFDLNVHINTIKLTPV